MNWNRKLIIPGWEKRRIRNRRERYRGKEQVLAYITALLILVVIGVGIVGQIILTGGL